LAYYRVTTDVAISAVEIGTVLVDLRAAKRNSCVWWQLRPFPL